MTNELITKVAELQGHKVLTGYSDGQVYIEAQAYCHTDNEFFPTAKPYYPETKESCFDIMLQNDIICHASDMSHNEWRATHMISGKWKESKSAEEAILSVYVEYKSDDT